MSSKRRARTFVARGLVFSFLEARAGARFLSLSLSSSGERASTLEAAVFLAVVREPGPSLCTDTIIIALMIA